MAHAAICQLPGLNMVFGHQLRPKDRLVGGGPVQIEHFITRPDEFFRRAMTLQAPFHVKHMRFPGQRHLVQLSVAGGTTNAFSDMDAVVEKDKIGRAIGAVPTQRSALVVTVPNGS